MLKFCKINKKETQWLYASGDISIRSPSFRGLVTRSGVTLMWHLATVQWFAWE